MKRLRKPYRTRGASSPDVEVIEPDGSIASEIERDAPRSLIEPEGLQRFVAACCIVYLSIYALEAPIRFGLYVTSRDGLILLRDGLIVLPLAAIFAWQLARLRPHPVFLVCGTLLGFHALVFMGTIGDPLSAAYGVKILINLVLGFFAASLLVSPGRWGYAVLAALWAITMVGVCLDKFVLTFPWTGIRTIVGDIAVDVSKDWQISDEFARRVAGFTRSSIAVAVFLPILAIILVSRIRAWAGRFVFLIASLAGVFLTTQKGAFLAFLPIAAILCLGVERRLTGARLCFGVFLLAMIAAPLIVLNLDLKHGTGVFSAESLFLRINYTWPGAWDWILRHQIPLLGVGIGGISGPQRFYAPMEFNPADNMFLLAYAYFGVVALLYLGWVAYLVFRPVAVAGSTRVISAAAMLAYAAGYGVVLSVIEDQSAGLMLGAALGVLWLEAKRYPMSVPHPQSRRQYAAMGFKTVAADG